MLGRIGVYRIRESSATDLLCLRLDREGRNKDFGWEYGSERDANAYDLGITVHHNLLGGFRRTGLTSLVGNLADDEYTHPEIDGFVVGSQYTQYLLDGTEPDWEQLLAYNRDDVLALKAVVERLRKLR